MFNKLDPGGSELILQVSDQLARPSISLVLAGDEWLLLAVRGIKFVAVFCGGAGHRGTQCVQFLDVSG